MTPPDPTALEAACRSLGLRLVVRFGSRSARPDRPPLTTSDLDLALLAGTRSLSLRDALIALTPVYRDADLDLVVLNRADPLLRYEVFRTGDLVWGDPDVFAEQQALAYRLAEDDRAMRHFEAHLLRRATDRLLTRTDAPS